MTSQMNPATTAAISRIRHEYAAVTRSPRGTASSASVVTVRSRETGRGRKRSLSRGRCSSLIAQVYGAAADRRDGPGADVGARRYPDEVTDTLSAAQARRIALAAQGFSRARPASVSARHIHRVMDRLGVLQIDSVNVFARSHYMPLFSRLGAYEPALFDRVFHSRTTHYVEYMAHEATFIPIEDWPLWRFRMDHFRARWAAPDSWMSTNTRTLRWVQDELRARGPLRPADLRDDAPRERGTWWDWDDAVSYTHLTLPTILLV